ncbi:PilN domain-containing protein [Synechococcus sp. CCY9201]|uniref:PilN domain-containing protein n=1 Tax=unclassified Synechococcus TaxID=2626047 RepID=UPI002B20393F|nr:MULTISPECIES: PilN domain-containing protein [unclassified Synechococcus]MEA5424659.1 PilN domain-containing protein [Synechococcus sp. CCY9202]MEA5474302.1 PilN domain-containing protein [Synechococcus sp. CCY9201]
MTVQTSRPPDLLRERRQELGIPELPDRITSTDQLLLRGALIGGGLVLLVVATAGFLFLRQQLVRSELDRLTAVQAEVEVLEGQVKARQAEVDKVTGVNRELAKGLVGVRSGSTVLRELQLRTPDGVQISQMQVEGDTLRLKGQARDPQAFSRINVLQLELKRSPLFQPEGVALSRAFREEKDPRSTLPSVVSFEMSAPFSELPPTREMVLLKRLGAEGMARRYQLLQKEGLLP